MKEYEYTTTSSSNDFVKLDTTEKSLTHVKLYGYVQDLSHDFDKLEERMNKIKNDIVTFFIIFLLCQLLIAVAK